MDVTQARKGTKLKMDGAPWLVVDYQFVKPGKGNAITKLRLKNLKTGQVVERTFKSGEQVEKADFQQSTAAFSYKQGDTYYFLNQETYEMEEIPSEVVGDAALYLKEDMECRILLYEGRPTAVETPIFVELEITYTEPGVKGDTVSGATKVAELETGAKVLVPLFIEQGEVIKVDTRTGEYVERVNR